MNEDGLLGEDIACTESMERTKSRATQSWKDEGNRGLYSTLSMLMYLQMDPSDKVNQLIKPAKYKKQLQAS